MRYVCMMLVAGLLSWSLAAQAADTRHQTESFSIALPAEWQVAPKQTLDEFGQKVTSAKLLMMAIGMPGQTPQMTAMAQDKSPLTQAEFMGLPDAKIKEMCARFIEGAKKAPGSADVTCARVTAGKGGALATQMTMQGQKSKMRNVSWTFYGTGKIVVLSAMFEAKDKGKITPQVEKIFKTLELK